MRTRLLVIVTLLAGAGTAGVAGDQAPAPTRPSNAFAALTFTYHLPATG